MSGTEVTAREVGAASFTASSVTITDDYVLITDGRAYRAGVRVHKRSDGGWTHVITVKCDPATPTPAPAPPGVGSEAGELTRHLTSTRTYRDAVARATDPTLGETRG